MQLVKVGG